MAPQCHCPVKSLRVREVELGNVPKFLGLVNGKAGTRLGKIPVSPHCSTPPTPDIPCTSYFPFLLSTPKCVRSDQGNGPDPKLLDRNI